MDLNEMQGKFKGTVVDYLAQLREKLGEDAWRAEIKKLALQAFQMGGQHEAFWREQIKDFDWISADDLKAQAAALPPEAKLDVNQLMAQALKARMPSCKTQAQFSAFKATFEAFEALANAIFNQDPIKEMEFRKVLDTGFLACKQATEISRKLEAVPEAATSKAAAEFMASPLEFEEYDIQRELLAEVQGFQVLGELRDWYADPDNKARMNKVKSQTLRDVLMDTIRSRIIELKPKDLPPEEKSPS